MPCSHGGNQTRVLRRLSSRVDPYTRIVRPNHSNFARLTIRPISASYDMGNAYRRPMAHSQPEDNQLSARIQALTAREASTSPQGVQLLSIAPIDSDCDDDDDRSRYVLGVIQNSSCDYPMNLDIDLSNETDESILSHDIEESRNQSSKDKQVNRLQRAIDDRNDEDKRKTSQGIKRTIDQIEIDSPLGSPIKYAQTGFVRSPMSRGSIFVGSQKSRIESYKFQVKLIDFQEESNYLCGYISIENLPIIEPILTTFFEGEIISDKYPFLTRRWEADGQIDRIHWSKFEDFRENHLDDFNSDSLDYDKLKKSDYIYMRWKEQFLVPDHKVLDVTGASYAGFYYICYSKITSQIQGYYYHMDSEYCESFQVLNLRPKQMRTSSVFEFR